MAGPTWVEQKRQIELDHLAFGLKERDVRLACEVQERKAGVRERDVRSACRACLALAIFLVSLLNGVAGLIVILRGHYMLLPWTAGPPAVLGTALFVIAAHGRRKKGEQFNEQASKPLDYLASQLEDTCVTVLRKDEPESAASR